MPIVDSVDQVQTAQNVQSNLISKVFVTMYNVLNIFDLTILSPR